MFPDFLTKLLGMQPQGTPNAFGALGGGLNGSAASPALPTAASNGMPMSGIGPGGVPPAPPMPPNPSGAPMQLTPGAGQATTPTNPGLWNPGGANAHNPLAQQMALQMLQPKPVQAPPMMPWQGQGTMRGIV